MWPAAAGHTHSGGRERLIFAFCVCFKCKSTGPRAREMEFSQANGFSQFISPNFGLGTRACGSVPAKFFFPTFSATDQFRSVKERSDVRSLLKLTDSSVIFSMKLVDRELSEEKILLLQQQTFSSK